MDKINQIIYINEETEIVLFKEIQSPKIGLFAGIRYHDMLRPLIPMKRKDEQVIVLFCNHCWRLHRIDKTFTGYEEYWNAN